MSAVWKCSIEFEQWRSVRLSLTISYSTKFGCSQNLDHRRCDKQTRTSILEQKMLWEVKKRKLKKDKKIGEKARQQLWWNNWMECCNGKHFCKPQFGKWPSGYCRAWERISNTFQALLPVEYIMALNCSKTLVHEKFSQISCFRGLLVQL